MAVILQDIIDNIIEAVDDSHLLQKCALVSSSFLLPSRKRLFSQIFLRNEQACQRLHQVLVKNPVIQPFVRSITITQGLRLSDSYSRLDRTTSLIAILRLPFGHLENFSIEMWLHSGNWNDFSSELKDALSAIIQSSTLKSLHLNQVNVPIMLFQGIHFTKLVLSSLSPNDFDGKASKLLTPATSEGVATTASHTGIDQCVWRFYSNSGTIGRTGPIFLPFMCRLRIFKIYIALSSAKMRDFDILSLSMRSLHVSLTSPATLEHLKFDILFQNNSKRFSHDAFYRDLRGAHVWRHLDSTIIRPTGSRLQRVDIDIQYNFRHNKYVIEPDNADILESVLGALPLLRKKGILSVKATVTRSG